MCIHTALDNVVEFVCLRVKFLVALLSGSISLCIDQRDFPSYHRIGQWRNWPAVSGLVFGLLELFYRVDVTSIEYPVLFPQEFFTQVRLISVELAQVISRSHWRLLLQILEIRAYSCSSESCEIRFWISAGLSRIMGVTPFLSDASLSQ